LLALVSLCYPIEVVTSFSQMMKSMLIGDSSGGKMLEAEIQEVQVDQRISMSTSRISKHCFCDPAMIEGL
jgi:hypothetical protein